MSWPMSVGPSGSGMSVEMTNKSHPKGRNRSVAKAQRRLASEALPRVVRHSHLWTSTWYGTDPTMNNVTITTIRKARTIVVRIEALKAQPVRKARIEMDSCKHLLIMG